MSEPRQTVCAPWATLDDAENLRGATIAALPGLEAMLDVASDLLYAASGYRWPGECEDVVRPCSRFTGSDSPAWHGSVLTIPTAWTWNASWGTCGCNRALSRACGCEGPSEITLGASPLVSVEKVTIDGVELDPALYEVHDYRWLVRLADADGTRRSWPCFPAGTLVLTEQGWKPIEAVTAGERVLTHRNRWRRVLRSGQTGLSETVQVKGHGGTLHCTPDHEFRSTELSTGGYKPNGKHPFKIGAPEWTPASALVGRTWATPRSVESLPIPLPDGVALPDNFWWVVGRWVGDGWTDKVGNRITLCCGHAETDALRAVLAETAWVWRETRERTATRFRVSDAGLRAWLRRHFGVGAADKRVPPWLLGAPEEARQEFLAGYLSADGHTERKPGLRGTVSAHLVSKQLALGLRLLAAGLGHAPTLGMQRQTTTHIEGRAVTGQPTYHVRWVDAYVGEPYVQAWATDEHLWTRVKSVALDPLVVPVYDIEVEEDHSFVAEGFVVHNCCSRVDLPATEEGTFEVEFTYGVAPPPAGVLAAVDLAVELLRANSGAECALPPRVTSMIRQGVQVALIDPMAVVAAGGFGVYSVDTFLGRLPKHRPSSVHVPSWGSRVRRRTG